MIVGEKEFPAAKETYKGCNEEGNSGEISCECEAQDVQFPSVTSSPSLIAQPAIATKTATNSTLPQTNQKRDNPIQQTSDISTSHTVTIASSPEDSPTVGTGIDPPLLFRTQDSLPESSLDGPKSFPTTISFQKDNQAQRQSSSSTSIDSNMKLPPNKRKIASLEHTKTQENAATVIPSPASSPKSPKRQCVSVPPIAPKPQSTTLLLARPKDDMVLTPLHAFVRKQIEVFSATARDIAQPAPGRKNPVALHQIGLRCIHCRDLPLKQRVKRAVCYPSSVGRVYHSVSDMKHDHFKVCPCMPPEIRQRFDQLKEEKTKSKGEKKASSKVTGCSSSTAQYYHDTALQMGMRDGKGGVFWNNGKQEESSCLVQLATEPASQSNSMTRAGPITYTGESPKDSSPSLLPAQPDLIAQLQACQQLSLPNHLTTALGVQHQLFQRHMQEQFLLSLLAKKNSEGNTSFLLPKPQVSKESTKMKAPETLPVPAQSDNLAGWPVSCLLDEEYLNPIHCFVRRHVEFFVAGEQDVKAPSPGRKVRAVLGQVGIRCVHCAHLSPKDRVKRSICYPPSIGGIYHAVSNIKCDHFALCKGLPASEKQEFLRLRSSGTRKTSSGSKTKPADRGLANSTAQYYHDSALRMGLIDTPDGIRFASIPNNKKKEEELRTKTESPVEGTKGGMAALMAATDLVAGTEAKATAVTGIASV